MEAITSFISSTDWWKGLIPPVRTVLLFVLVLPRHQSVLVEPLSAITIISDNKMIISLTK